MNEKIRTTIYVNKKNWKELSNYIDCTKSEWIDKIIEKRINQHDTVAEIEMQMKQIQEQQENLNTELEILSEQKKQILHERKINEKNYTLINKAMQIIRDVATNQGYIEQIKVDFIANKHNLNVKTLLKQMELEQIVVKDIEQRKDTDTGENAKGGYLK